MASLLSYALTNLSDVKESLGIASSVTTYDNLIIRKINQATRAIEAYCGRRFKETTYTNEEYDATNTDQLILKQRPITSLTTFSLGSRDTSLNDDDWEVTDINRYFVDNNAGVIDGTYNLRGSWNRYRVTYSAGYATIPEDLAEACASLAAYYFNEADATSVGISEKQEGQRRIKYASSGSSGASLNFKNIISQLGIDEIINSYANYPLLADK